MRVRKYKKSRNPHKVFLVLCEGETEEEYINLLKRVYRLPITIKTKVIGNCINTRLVSQYVKDLGVEQEDCSVFYVYDAAVKPVFEKILSLPGTPIISNPCIELWFLLHLKEHQRSMSSEGMLKELLTTHALWKSYAKGGLNPDQIRHLCELREIAIARAKKLKWPQNPSTNMYDFIEALENEKKLK